MAQVKALPSKPYPKALTKAFHQSLAPKALHQSLNQKFSLPSINALRFSLPSIKCQCHHPSGISKYWQGRKDAWVQGKVGRLRAQSKASY